MIAECVNAFETRFGRKCYAAIASGGLMKTVDWSAGGSGVPLNESFWVARVCCVKHGAAIVSAFFAFAAVDVLGREQGDSRMAMLDVVPCKEAAAVRTSLFDICKGARESRAILQRFVVRLDERIIFGNVRPRTAFYDAEVSEECGRVKHTLAHVFDDGINAFGNGGEILNL